MDSLDTTQRATRVMAQAELGEGPAYKERTRERLVALVIAAVLAFNYPVLFLFSKQGLLLGVPVFYLYLFVAWGLLILLAALAMERGSARHAGQQTGPSGGDASGA